MYDHELDKVQARDPLGDRVLDLRTRVKSTLHRTQARLRRAAVPLLSTRRRPRRFALGGTLGSARLRYDACTRERPIAREWHWALETKSYSADCSTGPHMQCSL